MDTLNFIESIHFGTQSNKRAVTNDKFDAVISYGEVRRRSGGTEEYILTSKAAQKAISRLKKEIKRIQAATNLTLICNDETLITTFKSNQKYRS